VAFTAALQAAQGKIIKLKDTGRVLMRFNEMREALQLRLSGELTRFTNDELKAVVSLFERCSRGVLPSILWKIVTHAGRTATRPVRPLPNDFTGKGKLIRLRELRRTRS